MLCRSDWGVIVVSSVTDSSVEGLRKDAEEVQYVFVHCDRFAVNLTYFENGPHLCEEAYYGKSG